MRLQSIPRKIALLMAVSVALFMVTVLGTVSWMARQHNIRAAQDSVVMVQGYLELTQSNLVTISLDYTKWDQAVEDIQALDVQSFYDNFGSGATTGDLFQILAVTDGPLPAVWSWSDDGEEAPVPDKVPAEIIAMLRAAVAEVPLGADAPVASFGVVEGELYAFVGTLIEPENITEMSNVSVSDFALAIFGYRLGDDALGAAAAQYLLGGLTVNNTVPVGQAAISLSASDGTHLTNIVWEPPRPGDDLMSQVGFPIGGIILAFVLISALVTTAAQRSASELAVQEARASTAARVDTLSGLPNRFAFKELTASGKRVGDGEAAILFLDVNGFKHINDSVGHKGGDDLIVQMSNKFRDIAKASIFLARVGGDEFIFVAQGPESRRHIQEIAEKIRIALLPEFRILGRGFHVSMAMGSADRDRDDIGFEELLRCADIAMYKAKKLGISEPVAYDPAIESETRQRRIVEEALHEELARGDEFSIAYQPIVDPASGEMVKAEALARWISEKIGKISPEVFISVAEETGKIIPLGQILLKKICQDLKKWPELRVSINISPARLNDGQYVRDLINTLAEESLETSRFEIEVTEGLVVSNVDLAAYKLDILHEAGFSTSLDDFGTGFSSIGCLKALPFNTLKIDKSFIAPLSNGESDREMVRAMIIMGHSLGQSVVCEGVETPAQRDILIEMGADLLQGYHFSMPVSLDELRSWDLKAQRSA